VQLPEDQNTVPESVADADEEEDEAPQRRTRSSKVRVTRATMSCNFARKLINLPGSKEVSLHSASASTKHS